MKIKINFSFLILAFIGQLSWAGWEVQWIDKFEGTGVNWDNWTAQVEANYNNEVQCYTADDSSENRNYDVSNGTLKIIARKQTVSCAGLGGVTKTWTSGRLNGKDKSEMQYGRIEARIRFHDLEGGTWPAFWMLENRIAENPVKGDNDTIHWPNPGAGEIDVWEWFSNSPTTYITNFFNTSSCGAEHRPTYAGGATDVTEFHDYALEWDATFAKFFMNDEQVASYDLTSCTQYKEPMFVLLNVAMGGNLGGNIDTNLTMATMEVDYVAHCIPSDANMLNRCNESTPLTTDTDQDGIGDPVDICPNTDTGIIVNYEGCAPEEIQTEPLQAAPTPTAPLSSVISLFSDEYPNISGINYNPNWGQATQVSQISIEGNSTLLYSALNYQGTDFDVNHQNVSAMKSVHVDFWTADSTSLNFFLISPGPIETAYALPVQTGKWVSVDIPLTYFANVDLTNLFQLKIEGNGTVYFDNIYFTSAMDTDNDGALDESDLCSDTPDNTDVDEQGCSQELSNTPNKTATKANIGTLGGLWFLGIALLMFRRRRWSYINED